MSERHLRWPQPKESWYESPRLAPASLQDCGIKGFHLLPAWTLQAIIHTYAPNIQAFPQHQTDMRPWETVSTFGVSFYFLQSERESSCVSFFHLMIFLERAVEKLRRDFLNSEFETPDTKAPDRTLPPQRYLNLNLSEQRLIVLPRALYSRFRIAI